MYDTLPWVVDVEQGDPGGMRRLARCPNESFTTGHHGAVAATWHRIYDVIYCDKYCLRSADLAIGLLQTA